MAATGKMLQKGKGGMRMVPVNESSASPFTLPEPSWIPDAQCQSCIQCQGKFDFLNRRHHCRRCGKCFCDTCSSAKVLLPRMLYVDPVRHCAGCTAVSKKENDFFEKHIKALMTGGAFSVNQTGETNDNDTVYTCKLSSDHRHLHFENEHRRLDDISLTDIDSLQIWTEEKDSDGNPLASGLAMKYKDSCGEMQLVKMVVAGQNKRQGQCWVASMQKAFKMIHDSRTSIR
ncbi:zinc finger FYVE domain-containing protein 21-like isoform X2 [Mercenaria mercenaria]|uniref:zinc finger FYVE domain-containing protein 21-like isoform X2 n=1 Tax=Mercenaria mercenaria TaxID=6596 RepID=UPI00234F6C18|nr:zinc finger FYVE domain-containing protein 21-like isoform X2 [Mercenaria mercenaria]